MRYDKLTNLPDIEVLLKALLERTKVNLTINSTNTEKFVNGVINQTFTFKILFSSSDYGGQWYHCILDRQIGCTDVHELPSMF